MNTRIAIWQPLLFALSCLSLLGCDSSRLERIAHAGGGYQKSTYTNSIDALQANGPYFNLFELDFSWTSDDHLVCVHSWDDADIRHGLSRTPPTIAEFQEYLATSAKFRYCTFDTLVDWLKSNPTKRVITDIKKNNMEGLRYISEHHASIQSQIIPQIYYPSEYEEVTTLGYPDIIWTLYRYSGDESEVLREAEQMTLLAITMPRSRVRRSLITALNRNGVQAYVHTVNSTLDATFLKLIKVSGIYTDWLKR